MNYYDIVERERERAWRVRTEADRSCLNYDLMQTNCAGCSKFRRMCVWGCVCACVRLCKCVRVQWERKYHDYVIRATHHVTESRVRTFHAGKYQVTCSVQNTVVLICITSPRHAIFIANYLTASSVFSASSKMLSSFVIR